MNRILCITIIAITLVLPCAAQAWKGMARINGVVLDDTGKAVEGAVVTLLSVENNAGPPPIKTDKRGKWAALGLAGGTWYVDVASDGYMKRQLSVQVSEVERMPPIKIQLEPVPPPQPAPTPQEQIQVGDAVVSPETAAAIETGNRLMGEQKYKEAVVEYEKARTEIPDSPQVKQALARAYYGAGEINTAITYLREVHTASPADTVTAVLLANLLLENGTLEEARSLLDTLPDGAISDPTAMINIGILYLNKNKPADALVYLEKAVKLDETRGESYYYRGLAEIQMNKKTAAKEDFRKTIELAPESTEASEAKEMIKAIQ